MSGSPVFSTRRLSALVYKESLQVVRDPSAILVTFALPTVLMFVFAYALSLDQRRVPIGVVLESDAGEAQSLAAAFAGTRFFEVTPARDRREVDGRVVDGELRGYVVIPQDFDARMKERQPRPAGADHHRRLAAEHRRPSSQHYAQGVLATWLAGRRRSSDAPRRSC